MGQGSRRARIFKRMGGGRVGVSSASINVVLKSAVTANFLDNEIESQDLLFKQNFAVFFLFDSKFYWKIIVDFFSVKKKISR